MNRWGDALLIALTVMAIILWAFALADIAQDIATNN